MSLPLYSDPYVSVSMDERTGLVRYVRSSTPYPSVEEARLVHTRFVGAVQTAGRTDLKLLLDVRSARARNDDDFEKAIMSVMGAFLPKFAMVAFVVRTAAGRLQTRRMAGARGAAAPGVFDNEPDALRYLGVG